MRDPRVEELNYLVVTLTQAMLGPVTPGMLRVAVDLD
jgi:hypothetical protein